MNRYLQTRVKTVYNVKSMVETKASVAPKLRARELWLIGGKRNRLKGGVGGLRPPKVLKNMI